MSCEHTQRPAPPALAQRDTTSRARSIRTDRYAASASRTSASRSAGSRQVDRGGRPVAFSAGGRAGRLLVRGDAAHLRDVAAQRSVGEGVARRGRERGARPSSSARHHAPAVHPGMSTKAGAPRRPTVTPSIRQPQPFWSRSSPRSDPSRPRRWKRMLLRRSLPHCIQPREVGHSNRRCTPRHS